MSDSKESNAAQGTEEPINDSPDVSQTATYSIQDYLSLGYIYLLCLGMIKEMVYYKFIGINILYYSNLMDVLLSPFVYMTKRIVIFIFIVVVVLGAFYLDRSQRKQMKLKALAPKIDDDDDEDDDAKSKKIEQPKFFFYYLAAMTVFFMFIGSGIGAGFAQYNRLTSGNFECKQVLEFNDGQIERVKIVGQNNDFVFYVQAEQKHVTVAPIRGNIKRIAQFIDEPEPVESNETLPTKDKNPNEAKPKSEVKPDGNSSNDSKTKSNPSGDGSSKTKN